MQSFPSMQLTEEVVGVSTALDDTPSIDDTTFSVVVSNDEPVEDP